MTTVYGQRFIIRDENAVHTLGGGIVLRPVATRLRGDVATETARLTRLETGDELDRVEEVLRRARFTRPSDLDLCAHTGVEVGDLPRIMDRLRSQQRYIPIAGTETYAVPSARDDLGTRLTAWLERHHRTHPELPGRPVDAVLGWFERITNRTLTRPLMDLFVQEGRIKRLGRFICAAAFAPKLSRSDEKLMQGMIVEIRDAGFQPPSLDTIAVAAQADKKRREQLREKVAGVIAAEGGVSVARVREMLGSTRKFVVPFLEYLDRIGLTKRVGDQRVLNDPNDP